MRFAVERFKNLVESLNPEEAARNSFHNFHTKGMDYVCLFRSPRLTVKLYTVEPGALSLNAEGYVVNPHNHGYHFETTVLTGWMKNVRFEPGQPARERHPTEAARIWCRSKFHSALKGGEAQLEYDGPGVLTASYCTLYKGDSYYMNDEDIHTIVLPTDKYAALLLVQYHDVDRPFTYFFQQSLEPISFEGLYQPMTPAEVTQTVNRARSMI
jgi:hypothetical protein